LDFGAIAIALAMAIWQGHCLIYGQAYFQVDESECNFTPGYSVEFLGFHWHPHFHLPPRSIPLSHFPLPAPALWAKKKGGGTSVGRVVRSAECIPRVQLANCTGNVAGNELPTGDWRLATGNW